MAKSNVTLKDVQRSKSFRDGVHAPNGQHSAHYSVIGRDGKDFVFRVPVGVSVLAEEQGGGTRLIAELNEPDEKVVIALGGRGGDGTNSFIGTKGQRLMIKLDLKLLADVGLVGFPNAGKSTLLRAVSRAAPKIANYPFTTITPNLGVIEYLRSNKSSQSALIPVDQSPTADQPYDADGRRITVADLPGLIDGAHRNIGLGHRFLKHIVRTRLLAFVVDIDGWRNVGGANYHDDWSSKQPLEVIQSLVNELDLYDPTILRTKPTLLVVSKLDTQEKRDQYRKLKATLKEKTFEVPSSKAALEEGIVEESFQFDKTVGISSVTGFNVEKLKAVIRSMIDLDEESRREMDAQQQQQHC